MRGLDEKATSDNTASDFYIFIYTNENYIRLVTTIDTAIIHHKLYLT
jgi:hypothetical protein